MSEKVTIEVDAEVKKALDNLEKIKEILSTLSSNGDLILPDSLNGITAEIPPSKFDSDISTNVAMVLSKINNKSPLDLASILAEKIKKERGESAPRRCT